MHVDYASRREGKTLHLTNDETKYKKARYSHLSCRGARRAVTESMPALRPGLEARWQTSPPAPGCAPAPDSMDRRLGSDSEAFFGIPVPAYPWYPTILFVTPNICLWLATMDGMPVSDLSPAAQDYLKLIWSATEWSPTPVTVGVMAERLGVRPSTVSDGIKKLARQGLVAHAPYGSIELTDAGREHAVAMVRRHRLLETFLVDVLGYGCLLYTSPSPRDS